jgi:aminopeptidase-like protein
MANDNCSGMMAWAMLLRALQGRKLRHTYRFVVSPETIGTLAYIQKHEWAIKGLEGGYCLNTCGGPDAPSYKASFEADASVDRAVRLAFRDADLQHDEHDFDAAGSDERQYASPGLRIPVGSIHRSKYYDYPEYHTSADDLSLISIQRIESVVDLYLRAIENLEFDRRYHSLCPIGEPMLSKRGLYRPLGGVTGLADHESAVRWQLQAAGEWTLDVAEQSGLKAKTLDAAGQKLEKAGLLREMV